MTLSLGHRCGWIVGLGLAWLPISAAENPPTITADAPWMDTQGQEIQAQGGCVVQQGPRLFWYGMAFTSSGAPQEVRCYTSSDLANWTSAGAVLNAPVGRRVRALVDGPTGRTRLFLRDRTTLRVFQAASPTGPFQPLASPTLLGAGDDGDVGVFAEADGGAWVAYRVPPAAGSAAAIVLAPLGQDGILGAVAAGLPTVNSQGATLTLESPAIWKRNDRYYATAGGASGWASSPTWVASAPALIGPWSPWTKLARSMVCPQMLTYDTFNSQHNTICEVRGEQGSLFVYWGDRWSGFTGYGTGNYVVMPLDFDGDSLGLTWYRPWHPEVSQGTFTQELRRFSLWRDPAKKKVP